MTEKSSIMLRADEALLSWLETEGKKVGLSRNAYAVMRLKEMSRSSSKDAEGTEQQTPR